MLRVPDLGRIDERVFAWMYGAGSSSWTSWMLAFSIAGGGWALLLLVPLFYRKATRPFAQDLAVALAVQAVWVWALKRLIGRVRPWIALGLAPPLDAPHDGSFPSGHAAGSFCVAAFLAVVLPERWPYARWSAAACATGAGAFAFMVAVSRVVLGAHFPADVAAGAGLGALVGGLFGVGHVARARKLSRPSAAADTPASASERDPGSVERVAERG